MRPIAWCEACEIVHKLDGTPHARLVFHPDDDRARGRLRAGLDRALRRARPTEAYARKISALRVRHASGWGRARATVGQVLSDRDDLPAVRHRSRVPLSLGHGAARSRLERPPPG